MDMRRFQLMLLFGVVWGVTTWFLTSALGVFLGRPLLANVAIRLPLFIVGGVVLRWSTDRFTARVSRATSTHQRDVKDSGTM